MKTNHLEHDIFLLMLNLSQVRDSERIRNVFLEAMNSFWDDINLRFVADEEVSRGETVEIATTHNSFGRIAVEGNLSALTDDKLALIRNSIGMLAIILENRRQAKLLSDENLRLDTIVQERTAELLRTNENLKREIVERRRAEEQIRQYADIVGKMQIGLYVYHLEDINDDRTLRMVAINSAASEITDLAMKDVLGKTLDENFPRLREKGIPQKYAEVVRTGIPYDLESIYYGDDRVNMAVFSVKAVPILGNCVAVLFEDISERKRVEAEIHKLNVELKQRVRKRTAELEAANKELTSFAYIVSHDLKAPLRGINHLTHWLVEDYADTFDDKGKEMIELLIGRLKRMDSLIDGILEYSRIGRIVNKDKEVNLNRLMREVIDSIAPPEHIRILIENELPVIVGDITRIVQVFQNLLNNAVEFMNKPQGEIKIGCIDEGSHWTFSVADNGPGIDPKYHEKIFWIFQTLESRDVRESAGIGLALVKKIVEFYNGKIWVESTPGKGSVFSFTLPKTSGLPDEDQ